MLIWKIIVQNMILSAWYKAVKTMQPDIEAVTPAWLSCKPAACMSLTESRTILRCRFKPANQSTPINTQWVTVLPPQGFWSSEPGHEHQS